MKRVWPFVLGAICVVVMLAGVAAWRVVTKPPAISRSPYEGVASLAELQQLPEMQLFYPGSDITDRLARETKGALGGPNPSFAGYNLGTQASDADIIAFYRQQLTVRGWESTLISRSTQELSANAWQKGDRIFRLAIRDKTGFLSSDTTLINRYATLYEVVIANYPARPH